MAHAEALPPGPPRLLLESLGVYLPARSVSTADVVAGCRAPLRFPLERMTGIRARRWVAPGEHGFELGLEAARRCLATSRHRPEDIDLLISASVGHCDGAGLSISVEPSTAVRLQHALGLTRALAFDLAGACAGMFLAMNVADAMMRSGSVRRALIVSGEHITHLTTTAQREIAGYLDPRMACLTLGDAGAAVVVEVSTGGAAGFESLTLRTLGRYADCCVGGPSDAPEGGAIMHTDALRLTEAAAGHGAEHALAALDAAGWPPSAFQHLIMHQTSATAIAGAMTEINRRLGAPVCVPANTIDNLAERGNTASTTHLLALADAIEQGRVAEGERIVFAISGSGLTIGTGLYVLDDLPQRMRSASTRKMPPVVAASSAWASSNGDGVRAGVRIAGVGRSAAGPGARATSVDLLCAAALDCLERAGMTWPEVDLLLFAGIHRTGFVAEPAIAALLAGALELGPNPAGAPHEGLLAFDICNGDVGFLDACHVAMDMLRSGQRACALVVTAEVDNNAERWPNERVGVAEAGGAVLLEPDARASSGFEGFLAHTLPESGDAYRSRCTNRDGLAYLEVRRDAGYERRLLAAATQVAHDLLNSRGLRIADVDHLLLPQRSEGFVAELGARLGAPPGSVVTAVGAQGDLSTASLPWAWRAMEGQGGARPGARALILAAGSGLQAAGALYRFAGDGP